jgi:subtilisin-like proprotein convertase family protein
MAALNGASANGSWNLFVFDDAGGDSGSIAGGWSLAVTTNTGTDLTYNMAANPGVIEIELRVSGGNYEIINRLNSAVLARQAVAATTSITVTGSGSADLLVRELRLGRHHRRGEFQRRRAGDVSG